MESVTSLLLCFEYPHKVFQCWNIRAEGNLTRDHLVCPLILQMRKLRPRGKKSLILGHTAS
jgi:hypothetical protein